ncbi:hypothetical protein BX285_1729 [Streptomyces sp. 1114.5]|uniref:hypothetical protein n=1 Tax=Streptomyces sp. 1114.5 TaxID=1938830 RepID=UPI000EB323D5|nr:hypothetical protein [Streptomyces sp. 1114.5]RKT17354.1 hypothetical protein BX285_1729 [Streptomyces sp. 1114.5]
MAGTRKTATAVVLAALALTATACNDSNDGGRNAAPAAPTTAAAASSAPTSTTPSADAPSTGAKPVKLTPAVLLEQVTQKTTAAKSAKISEVITVGQVTLKGKGAVSWADGLQGDITMDLSDSPLGSVLAPVTGGKTAPYRYTKDAMYMRLGGDAVDAFGGRHWLHYSKTDMAKASGGSTDQLKSADPVQGVRTLIAGGKVTEVGQETVNGKATTHYTGELSADDIAGATGTGLTQDELAQIKDNLTTAGVTSETIDVWVDADKLVVKRTEQADTKVGAMTATVSYSDYGTPVSTTAPDPSDTVELSELAKLDKGATG